jgi:hypothetical protein
MPLVAATEDRPDVRLEPGRGLAERLRFERHVAVCSPCRGYLVQIRETIRMSGTLTEESISPDAREALLEAFSDWGRKD